jgi:hypothetical protein
LLVEAVAAQQVLQVLPLQVVEVVAEQAVKFLLVFT